jgi:hypothetical protein
VHYLRVWGCLAYIKLPDKDLSAFSARSEAGMFVGYEPASKAYRVRVGNKVKVSENVKFFEDKLGIHTLLSETPLPTDVPSDIEYDKIPSTDEEEDWDFVPVDLSDAVDLNREAGRGGEHLLPANIEVMQRLNEVIRGHMLAGESGHNGIPGIEAPREGAVGTGELQESGVGGAEESNGVTSSGEASDTSDEAQEVPRRGTSRYDLRQTLAEPNRYIPGVYHVGETSVISATVLSPPTQNGAIPQPKLSSKNVKVPEDWWEAKKSAQWTYWLEAMNEEMNSIDSHEKLEYCERPPHAKIIPLKWVYALKTDGFGDIIRFKARLVAQGRKQRPGVDYFETFAPVSTHASRRVLLNLATSNGWKIHQVDVKTTFLNGTLEEEVYVGQPPCFFNGNVSMVCKLLKSLYGLKQAPRAWHKRLVEELENSVSRHATVI